MTPDRGAGWNKLGPLLEQTEAVFRPTRGNGPIYAPYLERTAAVRRGIIGQGDTWPVFHLSHSIPNSLYYRNISCRNPINRTTTILILYYYTYIDIINNKLLLLLVLIITNIYNVISKITWITSSYISRNSLPIPIISCNFSYKSILQIYFYR
jgi:hypothetical protein